MERGSGAPGFPALDEILAVCPRCGHQAVVRFRDSGIHVTCRRCGYSDHTAGRGEPTWRWIKDSGRDPVFRLPLWLSAECCGGRLLWAVNSDHLDYLERFVASQQRDRDFPSPPGDRGLAYKLPKWMQASGNRDEILKTIARLRRREAEV